MEIAKKYAFELETKTVKPLKDKSFTCYNTDTIKLEIEVMEESDYKCLDEFETKVEVIYSYPNGEVASPIKQTMEEGGIEIIPDSTITIIPAKGCLFPTEYLRIDINIYNEEEFITLRPFIFKVYKSTEGELVDDSEEVLQNMYDIKKEVTLLSEKLIELNDSVTNTITQINGNVEESTANMMENLEEANARVDECVVRVNTINSNLDNYFLRNVVLTPMDVDGKITFTTNIAPDIRVGDLLNKAFILTVSGSSYSPEIITTHVSIVYFIMNSGNVSINYVILANKSVQGVSLSISPQFSNGLTVANKDLTEFNIHIQTNILSEFIDNANCSLISTTNHIQNI